MNNVQRGMTVASASGNFGIVSDVNGDRITVQRDNGDTVVLEANQYTVRDGILYIRLGNQQEMSDQIAIPVVEEQITVGKREVESGGVRVATNVVETPVQEQVTLRDEEVRVERRPVNQTIDPSQIDQLQTGSIEVRTTDEEAVVSKQARVVEEVVVSKEVGQRTETIQDTVRRTDVDIDQVGGSTTTGTSYATGTSTTGSQTGMGGVGGTTSSGMSDLGGTTGSGMGSAGGSSMGSAIDTTSSSMGGVGGTTSGSTGSVGDTTSSSTGSSQDEGLLSRLGNAIERGTGFDVDRDGDVGRRG